MELELAAAQCSSSSSTDNSQDSDSDEEAGKSPVLLLSPPPHSVFMSEIEVWFNGKIKIIFILSVSKSPPLLLL